MSIATVRSLIIAGAAVAGVVATPALAPYAYAQTQVAPVTTTDPTLQPDTAMPKYPSQSRKGKEAGVVRMKLCVEADGRVSKADLAQTSGFPNLDNTALKWVSGIRFNPAMQGATPVAICDFPMKYEFQVTKGPTRQEQTNNPFDIGPAGGLASRP